MATSAKIQGPLSATPLLAVDLVIPHLQSPNWNGQIQLSLNAPSVGLHNVTLPAKPFRFPYTVFQRVQFELPNDVVTKLNSAYSDLQIVLAITGGAGTYWLDNLRFISAPEAVQPPVPISSTTILDLDNADLWTCYAPGVLGASNRRVHGSRSLSVSGVGWTRIDSAPMSMPTSIGSLVAFDLLVPSPQNGAWRGAVDLIVSLPSAGINELVLGHQELQSLTLDKFQRIQFPVPSEVRSKLSAGTYQDLRFSFVVNVPAGTPGQYLIDNLRFREEDGTTQDIELPPLESIFAAATAKNLAPPEPIPVLGGSGAAAVASARNFIDWVGRSRQSQVVAARAVITNARTNPDIVNAVIAEIDVTGGDLIRNLMAMSVLGELQTPTGETFATQIIDLPLPAGDEESPDFIRLETLQTKAVDVLAFTRTSASRTKLLDVAANHPSRMVRIEAIRDYLETYGSTARATLLAVVRTEDKPVLDSFPHRSERTDPMTYDQKLQAYRAKYPDAGVPSSL